MELQQVDLSKYSNRILELMADGALIQTLLKRNLIKIKQSLLKA
jgi:hypothetical protein